MQLEVCVDSLESAINAEKGGADRLELCSALALGGLTPTAGLLKTCKEAVSIPIMCMVRCRHGDFEYKTSEMEVMLADVEVLKEVGCHGVVFGALTSSGALNVSQCEEIMAAAHPLPVTLHRAFDVCWKWEQNLEDAIQCGFSTVLTSGQATSAHVGHSTIKDIIKQAQDVTMGSTEPPVRVTSSEKVAALVSILRRIRP